MRLVATACFSCRGFVMPLPAKGPRHKTGAVATPLRPEIAGALAKDESGRLHVLHNGKIGGAKKGVGKALFEAKWKGGWRAAGDGLNSSLLVCSTPRTSWTNLGSS